MSVGSPVQVEPVAAFLVLYDSGRHGQRVLSHLRTDGFEGIRPLLDFSGAGIKESILVGLRKCVNNFGLIHRLIRRCGICSISLIRNEEITTARPPGESHSVRQAGPTSMLSSRGGKPHYLTRGMKMCKGREYRERTSVNFRHFQKA